MSTSKRPWSGSMLLGRIAAGVAVLGLGAGGSAPAAAFPMSGCELVLTSIDGGGEVVDVARSGAADATVEAPFEVAWDGRIAWQGSTGPLTAGQATYHVTAFGLPTPVRGQLTIPDRGGEVSGSGEVEIRPNFAVRIAGVALLSGAVVDEAGGRCEGSAWVRLAGSPVGTLPWLAGVLVSIVGIAALAVGWRGRRESHAVAGGFLAGVGLALLSVTHGILPLAERTPLALVIVGVAIGLGVAVLLARQPRPLVVEPPDDLSGRRPA